MEEGDLTKEELALTVAVIAVTILAYVLGLLA